MTAYICLLMLLIILYNCSFSEPVNVCECCFKRNSGVISNFDHVMPALGL